MATEAQIAAIAAILSTQTIDLVQATVIKMLNINKRTMSLEPGSTPVTFEFPYDTGVEWDFTFLKANAADGFDVGISITNSTQTGFTATVEEACTFKFKAESFNEFISD